MAQATATGGPQRLEDYIGLAHDGKKVEARVELRKQPVRQKVHPEDTPGLTSEIGMYLLIGDYTITVGGETHSVSKVYAFGSDEESLETTNVNKNIATERLKMDYRRLKEAGIEITEKSF